VNYHNINSIIIRVGILNEEEIEICVPPDSSSLVDWPAKRSE